MKKKILNLKTEIFADGADIKSIEALTKKKYVKGITTNPSLMRKSGVKNYIQFAKQALKKVKKNQCHLKFLQIIQKILNIKL